MFEAQLSPDLIDVGFGGFGGGGRSLLLSPCVVLLSLVLSGLVQGVVSGWGWCGFGQGATNLVDEQA